MSPIWILKRLLSVFINDCCNLAEGGSLLSRFQFMRCCYFLGHVACQNLPWQGLSIVLTSQWLLCIHCFTSLLSFTGFYTKDEPAKIFPFAFTIIGLTYVAAWASLYLYNNCVPLFRSSILPCVLEKKLFTPSKYPYLDYHISIYYGTGSWHAFQVKRRRSWLWKSRDSKIPLGLHHPGFEGIPTMERSLLMAVTLCWGGIFGISCDIIWSVIPLGFSLQSCTTLSSKSTTSTASCLITTSATAILDSF